MGIKFGDLLNMTPEQLLQKASKVSAHIGEDGLLHVPMEFADDDMPEELRNALFDTEAMSEE